MSDPNVIEQSQGVAGGSSSATGSMAVHYKSETPEWTTPPDVYEV